MPAVFDRIWRALLHPAALLSLEDALAALPFERQAALQWLRAHVRPVTGVPEPVYRWGDVLAAMGSDPRVDEHAANAGPASPAPPGEFLSADETAALLRTSRKAVYAKAERGQLPGVVRDGKRLLVRRADLLRSLAETRVRSPGGIRR